jgi:large subunit ribosomal protein L21
MYAVIETGGKQYRVNQGDVIRVDKLDFPVGAMVEAGRVLAVGDGTGLKIGTPVVPEAKVVLKVLAHEKGKKIIVFKYKPKKNYRRKTGHRQQYTRVMVETIQS